MISIFSRHHSKYFYAIYFNYSQQTEWKAFSFNLLEIFIYILGIENFPQENNSEKFCICGKITLHYSSDFKNIPSEKHWFNMNTNMLCLIGLMWKSCLYSGLGKRTGPSMTKMINNNIKGFSCRISFREMWMLMNIYLDKDKVERTHNQMKFIEWMSEGKKCCFYFVEYFLYASLDSVF